MDLSNCMSYENQLSLHLVICREALGDIYLIRRYFDTSFERIIRSKITLTDEHIQYFLYQMLISCHFLHSTNIIHTNLKPWHFLVNKDCLMQLRYYNYLYFQISRQNLIIKYLNKY